MVLVGLLAGLPWALTHFIGWPLPDHVPSWAEVEGVLLGPMTTTFLLDFLACASWLVWALFTLDVARCAVEIARDARLPDLSAAGPVHRVAAVLVGAVLISILGHRTDPARTSTPFTGPDTGSEIVATAPAWHYPSDQGVGGIRHAAYAAPHHTAPAVVERLTPAKSDVVRPYDPETGVYDSLWRMSERTLGDGNRWPEIYELNKGKPQPDGGTFTRPSLVFAGEEMALPDDATVPTTPPDQHAPPPLSPAPPPPPAPVTPPPATSTPSNPATPAPSTQQTPHTTPAPQTTPARPNTQQAPQSGPDVTGEPGFRWGDELFVGLGLAAAVSAALLVARRRHRRRYRPGSGDRTDLPVAPVVYQLRLAHLRADQDDDLDLDAGEPDERPRRTSAPPVVLGAAGRSGEEASVLAVGVLDGREIALDLAAAHGLGLIGAGAPAAVRALLVATLATTSEPVRVIVPAADLAALLGRQAARTALPASLRVVADLDTALDELEAETLVRASRHQSGGADAGPPVVLVARAPERQRQRLQAVLDNGAGFGVTGLLLGQWAPGVTAYVRDDGTISATSPGPGEPLRGTRVFRLGDTDTADLLVLLHRADPEPEPVTVDEHGPPSRPRPHAVAGDTDPDQPVTPEANENGQDAATGQAEVSADDTDLEILPADGAAQPPADTELEILGSTSSPVSPPGLRLRPSPPAPARNEPAGEVTGNADTPDAAHAGNRVDSHRPERPGGSGEDALVPLRISVLGPPRVWWRPEPAARGDDIVEREITSEFQPRVRELLVFLALHPDGASREALIGALWAHSPLEKTTNAMNTSLSRLRRAVTAATDGALSDIVLVGEGRYRLDPDLVEVDYHRFAAAVATRRAAATEQDRVEAYRHIVDHYGGPLADGMSTEWIETAREAIRRDAIDAVAALARALVDHDPQQTLDLLEVARAFDPHNELIYRDIMRLQERLGQLDAIPRTLTLLTTRLAEVDDRPSQQAVSLADRLRRRHEATTEQRPPLGADREHSRAG
ncbi:BTAD domain-containing putative transcriptional regulator [Saccharothrix deserti]|uniref:BTAD domain-containing putative transcriptional regulator n=1 Tax=Saccharothrix deserti TaxID=2593674 RepID=UPI001EE3DE68|nr:BTAD domain-containing putative transcriptional regulator [Saccharothrix deserti]